MSLQYIIDAYNLTNHPRFKRNKQSPNIQQALVDFIMQNAPLAQLSDAETGYAWIQNRKTEAATLDLSSIVVTPLPVNEKTASANQPTTSGTATL